MDETRGTRPEERMDPGQRQLLDDVFDAFTMISKGDIVNLMHVQGNTTRWSSSAVELFGLPGEYIENGAFDWTDYVHPEDRRRYLDAMIPLTSGELHTYDLTYRVRTKDGEYQEFRVIGSVLRSEEGAPSLIGGIMISEGVTDDTDPITILRNKNGMMKDLGESIQEGRSVMALLTGISKLSHINRVYGYSYGNRVLQQVGWIIQETLRDRGTVYRTDDATFAILTDRMDEQELSALYDSLRVKLQRGVRVEGARHPLAANGGLVSVSGLRRIDPETVYASLRYAYRESKSRRRGDLVSFSGGLDRSMRASLEMVDTIREAIIEGCEGFSVLYQPVYSAETDRPVAVEALLRWTGDPYGEVPPMEFLPALEGDFVFEELGTWILERALADGRRLLERVPDVTVGLNVAPSQLEDEYFLDGLTYLLRKAGFPADRLCLELTRPCRDLDRERLIQAVRSLRETGVQILLDDFGSGSDSLGCLKALAPDHIKLDLGLVRSAAEDERDLGVLLRLVETAALYGTSVCVKGVETARIRELFRGAPVRSWQGYLRQGPAPFEEILERAFPAV